jgi:hypothetical protein
MDRMTIFLVWRNDIELRRKKRCRATPAMLKGRRLRDGQGETTIDAAQLTVCLQSIAGITIRRGVDKAPAARRGPFHR